MFYIPTHIIITSKLSGDHPILKILSKSVKRDELSDFISSVSGLTSKGEKGRVGGRAEGRAEGRALILEVLVKDGTISAERAKILESQSKNY